MKFRATLLAILLLVLVSETSCPYGDKSAEEGWTPVPVVVANQDVPAGTWIDYDMVAKLLIPERFIPPSVVKPSDFEKVVGLQTRFDLQRGDLIQWPWFQTEAEQDANMSISKMVRRAGRAMTLRMAGTEFVAPNDHIDILVTLIDPKTGKSTALTVLQNVIVLGTEWIDTPDGPENRLTLIVLPEEAQNLALSSRTGQLHAAVRNPEDLSGEDGPGVDLTTVTNQNVLNQLARKRREFLTIRLAPVDKKSAE